MISIAKGPYHIHKPKGEESFFIEIDNLEYIDNLKNVIREREYTEIRKDWHNKQKSWSNFDTYKAERDSKPNNKMAYANLFQKIFTGTIWTEKRKMTLGMQKEDYCKICKDKINEIISDSHEHALGDCIFTQNRRDKLWLALQEEWRKLGIKLITIRPWFTTESWTRDENISIDTKNCNRGLLPKEIIKILKRRNKKVDTTKLRSRTISLFQRNIITTYIDRINEFKKFNEETDGNQNDNNTDTPHENTTNNNQDIRNFFIRINN